MSAKASSSSSDYKGCGPDCVYQNELAQPSFGTASSSHNWGVRALFRSAATDYLRIATGEATPAQQQQHEHQRSRDPSDPMDVRSLSRYYRFNLTQVAPQFVSLLKPFGPDEETQEWLNSCRSELCTSFIASFLRRFMSVTDVNGLLRRGQMFIFSQAMARDILFGERGGVAPSASGLLSSSAEGNTTSGTRKLGRLLDVGAGDGGVTAQFAPFFEHVTATEVSSQMAKRLREKGYRVFQTPFINAEGLPGVQEGSFDVVSIFNVLDRCDHPGALLSDARRLLHPSTGRLILAIVLPFSEFVEEGTIRRRPYGQLPMTGYRCSDGVSFEASMSALLSRAIVPAGFEVVSIARLPYLCRGDASRPYYVLSDAIVVCKPRIGGGGAVATEGSASAGFSDTSGAGIQSRSAAGGSVSSSLSSRIPFRPGASAASSASADVDSFARMAFGAGGVGGMGIGSSTASFLAATKAE